MVELFWGLYSLILAAALGRWFEIERAGKVRPFTVSIFYFFFAVGCLTAQAFLLNHILLNHN